jgi:hypothetical protein
LVSWFPYSINEDEDGGGCAGCTTSTSWRDSPQWAATRTCKPIENNYSRGMAKKVTAKGRAGSPLSHARTNDNALHVFIKEKILQERRLQKPV